MIVNDVLNRAGHPGSGKRGNGQDTVYTIPAKIVNLLIIMSLLENPGII
jgi:hypothetical protein